MSITSNNTNELVSVNIDKRGGWIGPWYSKDCVYHTSVFIDSTHMVVGLDGYNETASVTIPRGDYSAMSIANMIVVGFNRIDGNRVTAKEENGVKINLTPQSNDDPSLIIISNDNWNNNILYMEKTEPSNISAKDTTPQFHVNDYVGVTRRPRILEKRSLTSKWSNDLYEVVGIDDHIMPLMYEVKDGNNGKRKCYHWELLASKCKPQPAPPITRSKSRKEPNALREAARSHRPVTRSQKKKGVRKRS